MSSKISVFLRSATEDFSKVLRNNGFLTVAPGREEELNMLVEKFNDEMYGAPYSGSPRRKQTDVRVISETPIIYDRDYLTKQSVQELLRIAKAKGCKNLGPRKKESLIEKLLLHFTSPPLVTEVDQVQSEASSQASDITTTDATDDELRPEPVPADPTIETKEKKPRKKKEPTNEPPPVPTGDAPSTEPEPAKKPRKKKEKSDDESSQVVPTGDAPAKKERKKKEKSDESKAERKNKGAPAANEEKQEKEDEEEITIAVRSWIHPKEQDKPPADRTRYCIDPITNNIYNPEELTDQPIGRWDDDAQEIIPF